MGRKQKRPKFPLDQVFEAIDANRVILTNTARRDAIKLGYDVPAVLEVVKKLNRDHFQRTVESRAEAGRDMDIYHIRLRDLDIVLYIKIQDLPPDGYYVVSFHPEGQWR